MAKKKTAKKPTKKRGTTRSGLKAKKAANVTENAAMMFMRRFGYTIMAVIAIIWCGSWFFVSGADKKTASWIKQSTSDLSVAAGFAVKDVLVEGREHTDAELLLAVINVRRGESIFTLNPHEAKKQVEKIGWVKKAHVERRLPDTIHIRLTEHKPMAFWKDSDGVSLINENGVEITRSNLNEFKDLPLLRGSNAANKAPEIIAALNAYPQLMKTVDHAALIDKRRWNIALKNGQRIKLPEKKVRAAIDHIMTRHAENNILDKKVITEIDARYEDRLIIKTESGGVQDYKAGHVKASMTTQ